MAVLLIGFVDGTFDHVGVRERPVDEGLEKEKLENISLGNQRPKKGSILFG